GTEKARNVYGNNLISRKSGNTTAYYMYNGHGDVTNLLDGKGAIIGSYYYDAFGNVQENTSTFSNPYRYAGYQYDEEIGKYYLLNRMYDPESARFMQEDTYRGNANDPLSLNLYTYVNNNPMIYDDQNGHWPSFIDNFVSSAKSVVSSAISYVKETASNIYNAVINLPSTISSGFNYAKDTVYSWGKTINSTYKTVKTVYNKVVKPVATNYAKQKIEEVKTGITVKAGEVADYVKGLDAEKLGTGFNKVLNVVFPGVTERYEKRNDSLYDGINYWTAGIAGTINGAINPDKPLSLQHWIDSAVTASMLIPGAKFATDEIGAMTSSLAPKAAERSFAGDNKGSFLKGISNLENDAAIRTKGVGEASQLAKPGEDLYVGTYSKSRYANVKSGLNETHTPHHAVQDAISETSHGRGITINIRKDLHELTGTFKKTRDIDPTDLRKNLAADAFELKKILTDAGYDRSTINRQLKELIRQNEATGNFIKK
ncbi:RHS repeat-associated core domain-containing protein, partial [Clostridium sp. YIM B02505]